MIFLGANMGIMTCPHCNNKIKYFGIDMPTKPATEFEHAVPTGFFGQFWHRVVKNRPLPGRARPTDTTIRIETFDHARQRIEFQNLDKRLTLDLLRQVARLIITKEMEWTRYNLTMYTDLSENKTRLLVNEFKRLNYLNVSDNNRSEMTVSGKRFLRMVLTI